MGSQNNMDDLNTLICNDFGIKRFFHPRKMKKYSTKNFVNPSSSFVNKEYKISY